MWTPSSWSLSVGLESSSRQWVQRLRMFDSRVCCNVDGVVQSGGSDVQDAVALRRLENCDDGLEKRVGSSGKVGGVPCEQDVEKQRLISECLVNSMCGVQSSISNISLPLLCLAASMLTDPSQHSKRQEKALCSW